MFKGVDMPESSHKHFLLRTATISNHITNTKTMSLYDWSRFFAGENQTLEIVT